VVSGELGPCNGVFDEKGSRSASGGGNLCEFKNLLLAITETDGLALTMLSMIMLSFGVILTLLVCMLRSSSRRDAEVDRLLEDFEEEGKKNEPAKTASEEKKEDWEKDGDWWKGE